MGIEPEDLLNTKPVKTLIEINKSNDRTYCTPIAEKVDTTYAHQVKIIDKLEQKGLVDSNIVGRKKILSLTSKGQEYAELFTQLMQLMDQEEKIETGMEFDLTEGDPIKT